MQKDQAGRVSRSMYVGRQIQVNQQDGAQAERRGRHAKTDRAEQANNSLASWAWSCIRYGASSDDPTATHSRASIIFHQITEVFQHQMMSNRTPRYGKQASKLCTQVFSSSTRQCSRAPSIRATVSGANRIPHRTYVSATNPDKANVNLDTVISADHRAFTAQTGALPENVKMPTTGMSADTMMSPAAGILKQATVMDEGTRPIYLDMQATTPTDPRVLDAMLPFLTGLYGNPHSRTHAYGWETEKAAEQARQHIADVIGANSKEIIFTSGATESNNMSIKGVARFFGRSGKKKHIITTQTEHKCVLDSCRHLQEDGFEVTYLPVQNSGIIDLKDLEAAIRPDTALVSIMTVNNEIGVIQPMKEIGHLCRSRKVFFHTDAAQAVGKIPINVDEWNVDLMSISSHKIYGPKGIGACYVRRRPRVRIEPIISGGGQERGLRSGTLAPPLVVGFGEACRIAKEEMEVRTLFTFLNYDQYSSQSLAV